MGEAMPDFTLTDQLGNAVRLSDFRTRGCRRLHLHTLPSARRLPAALGDFAPCNLASVKRCPGIWSCLSITIDPRYDTADVLLKYAKILDGKAEGWRFLTGPDGEIES